MPDGHATHTTASGENYLWTFSFENHPAQRTLYGRFALWYWCRFVLKAPHICLCHIGLGRVCRALEDRACRV